MRLALARLRHERWSIIVPLGLLAFALGFFVHGRGDHTLVFACPPAGQDGVRIGEISRAAPRVIASAQRHRGAAAGAPVDVVAVIAIGEPGSNPLSTQPLTDDARRRCKSVMHAWAIVVLRPAGTAGACCLDTTFVATRGARWFVF